MPASQSHSADFEGERTQFRSPRGTKVLTVDLKISVGIRSARSKEIVQSTLIMDTSEKQSGALESS